MRIIIRSSKYFPVDVFHYYRRGYVTHRKRKWISLNNSQELYGVISVYPSVAWYIFQYICSIIVFLLTKYTGDVGWTTESRKKLVNEILRITVCSLIYFPVDVLHYRVSLDFPGDVRWIIEPGNKLINEMLRSCYVYSPYKRVYNLIYFSVDVFAISCFAWPYWWGCVNHRPRKRDDIKKISGTARCSPYNLT